MSANEVNEEKVVTKYDRKMQRRKEEREKELKSQKIWKAIGVVCLLILLALILYSPVKRYVESHSAYIVVNGEKITKPEYDYYYNTVYNNYGAYAAYFGEEFFEESAVGNIKQVKGLKAEAKAAGFSYDTSGDAKKFKEDLKNAAKDANMSSGKLIKQLYGEYATVNSVCKYLEEASYGQAYLDELAKTEFVSTEEEINEYYNEHTKDYSRVDYYFQSYPADVPENATEDEIQSAMNDAYMLASSEAPSLEDYGDQYSDAQYYEADDLVKDWLFDQNTAAGDYEVFEDSDNHLWCAVKLEDRSLNDAETAKFRMITVSEGNGEAIRDEWEALGGEEKTEDKFIEFVKKYSEEDADTEGLYEKATEKSLSDAVAELVFGGANLTSGTVSYCADEDGYEYLVYFNDYTGPEWRAEIEETLKDQAKQDYLQKFEDLEVDGRGHLSYLLADEDVSGGDVSEGDASDGDAPEDEDVSGNDAQ